MLWRSAKHLRNKRNFSLVSVRLDCWNLIRNSKMIKPLFEVALYFHSPCWWDQPSTRSLWRLFAFLTVANRSVVGWGPHFASRPSRRLPTLAAVFCSAQSLTPKATTSPSTGPTSACRCCKWQNWSLFVSGDISIPKLLNPGICFRGRVWALLCDLSV